MEYNCYYLHLESPGIFFDEHIVKKNGSIKEIKNLCDAFQDEKKEAIHSKKVKTWFNDIYNSYKCNYEHIEKDYNYLKEKYSLNIPKFDNFTPELLKKKLDNLLKILDEGEMICTSLYRGSESYYVHEKNNELLSEHTIEEDGYILPLVCKNKFKDQSTVKYNVVDYLKLTNNGKLLNQSPASTIIEKMGKRNFFTSDNISSEVYQKWYFYE